MISADDVRNAYRFFLGREPETEEVVNNHVKSASDMRSLRARFLAAPEFYKNNARDLLRYFAVWQARQKHRQVEYDCGSADLARLFAHVARVWSDLGVSEPHFSVLSTSDFKPESVDSNRAAFFSSGRGEVDLLKSELDGLGLKSGGWRHCVELGCGVGRVTRYLTHLADSVTGYDVSQPHLALAGEYLAQERVETVALVHVADPSEVVFSPCDLFYSRMVLQHNPPPVMRFLLARILAALEPHGVAVFQLPIHIEGYGFSVEDYFRGIHLLNNQEIHMLPQKAVFEVIAAADCDVLSVYRDNSLSSVTQVSNRFIVRKRG